MTKKSLKTASLLVLSLASMAAQQASANMPCETTLKGCGTTRFNRVSLVSGDLFACAPEVKRGNIAAVDRVLSDLSKNELAGQKEFKHYVLAIQPLENEKKMHAYMKMMGVTSDQELVDLAFGRTIEVKYIRTLSENTSLTNQQSELVLSRISKVLLGERK